MFNVLVALLVGQCFAMPRPFQLTPRHYYGSPKNGCRPDEVRYTAHGLDLCTSSCDQWGAACPRDVPSGTTAVPDCALSLKGQGACALVCRALRSPSPAAAPTWHNLTCPPGATCSQRGLCTYDKDGASPKTGATGDANQTHYGNPKTGCRTDEFAYKGTGRYKGFVHCSSQCDDWGEGCPWDRPVSYDGKEATATGQCTLSFNGHQACALMCDGPLFKQQLTCPKGSWCKGPAGYRPEYDAKYCTYYRL